MQAVELGRRVGQGQGSRRVSMAGGDGRLPRRQGSWVEGPRRQSSGSGSRLGLRRQGSSGVISTRMAPMQLEQLLTGKQLPLVHTGCSSRCCCQFVCVTLLQSCVQLHAGIVQHCSVLPVYTACLVCLSVCLSVMFKSLNCRAKPFQESHTCGLCRCLHSQKVFTMAKQAGGLECPADRPNRRL